jgi:WhiB family redox-sensing transcriptional regulator
VVSPAIDRSALHTRGAAGIRDDLAAEPISRSDQRTKALHRKEQMMGIGGRTEDLGVAALPYDSDDMPAIVARRVVDRLILMRARCYDPRGFYTHLFHSEDPIDIARAQAICARCTVQDLCFARALERREPCGVWGGEIFHEGEVVLRRPRRGRRPKRIAKLIVDEVTGLECAPIADAV